MVNLDWPTAMASEADSVGSVSASPSTKMGQTKLTTAKLGYNTVTRSIDVDETPRIDLLKFKSIKITLFLF